jgi:nitrite reductase/ring-hydroxylating ferredoxin subunit
MDGFVDACADGEIEPGAGRSVPVADDAKVALFRTPGGYVALADSCPHQGAPLSEGVFRGGHVICSWHGWRFDAETGHCPIVPQTPRVAVHEVRVAEGRVWVSRRPG